MKNDNYFNELHFESLNDFHFGHLIEEESEKKKISPKQLSDAISRYQNNETKIFKLNDLNAEDAVRLSYVLEYNLLEKFSKTFLSHLPPIKSKLTPEKHSITFNLKARTYDLHANTGNCDFLSSVNFGRFLKALSKQKGWNEIQVAEQLNISQSTVSYLYLRKSIKAKKMVQISNAFQHNLIAELYLSQMMLIHPLKIFDQTKIKVIDDHICLSKPNDKNFPLIFKPQHE